MFIGVKITKIVFFSLFLYLMCSLLCSISSDALVELVNIDILSCLIFKNLVYNKHAVCRTKGLATKSKENIESQGEILTSTTRKKVEEMESEFFMYFKEFIKNINYKLYVGSSVNLDRRLRVHLHFSTTSNTINKNNQILYKAIKKYKL